MGIKSTSNAVLIRGKLVDDSSIANNKALVYDSASGTLKYVSLTSILPIAESDVTNLVSDLALKAPLASPSFTGTVGISATGAVTYGSDIRFRRTSANNLTFDNGAGGVAFLIINGTLNATAVVASTIQGPGTAITSIPCSNLIGTMPTTRLGSGTADATTFLRGDNTWQPLVSSPWTAVTGGIVNAGKVGVGVTDFTLAPYNVTLAVNGDMKADVFSTSTNIANGASIMLSLMGVTSSDGSAYHPGWEWNHVYGTNAATNKLRLNFLRRSTVNGTIGSSNTDLVEFFGDGLAVFAGGVLCRKRLVTGVTDLGAVTSDVSGLDAILQNQINLTLGASITINAPSPNITDGQSIVYKIYQTDTTSYTVTFAVGTAGSFRFGSDVTSIPAIASGKTLYVSTIYNGADNKWDIVSTSNGY